MKKPPGRPGGFLLERSLRSGLRRRGRRRSRRGSRGRSAPGAAPCWTCRRISSLRRCSSSCSFFCCSSSTFGSIGGPSKPLAKPSSGMVKLTSRAAWFCTCSVRTLPAFIRAKKLVGRREFGEAAVLHADGVASGDGLAAIHRGADAGLLQKEGQRQQVADLTVDPVTLALRLVDGDGEDGRVVLGDEIARGVAGLALGCGILAANLRPFLLVGVALQGDDRRTCGGLLRGRLLRGRTLALARGSLRLLRLLGGERCRRGQRERCERGKSPGRGLRDAGVTDVIRSRPSKKLMAGRGFAQGLRQHRDCRKAFNGSSLAMPEVFETVAPGPPGRFFRSPPRVRRLAGRHDNVAP